MIMRAEIYEICSFQEIWKRNYSSPSIRPTVRVQRGLILGVECCRKVTGEVDW